VNGEWFGESSSCPIHNEPALDERHHLPDWNAIARIAFINSRLVRAGRALEKKP
jgi:hypothetical protein